jgi:hypothetical protein
MIGIQTVLILGAGASSPYGFPTGQQLKDKICKGKDTILWQNCGFDRVQWRAFIDTLIRAGCSSVDTFLESRSEYVEIGKAAIAAQLLPCEKDSTLFDMWVDVRLDATRAKQYEHNWPWYEHIFGVLSDGVPFSELYRNRLSIITFNYDRSFEHFLITAMMNRYGRSESDCSGIINQHLEILHVYGSLGKLPWQTGADERKNVVAYGVAGLAEGARAVRIRRAAENITILHEGHDNSSDFERARRLITQAEQALFLGFGYHPVNLRRLGIGGDVLLPHRAWGTAVALDKEHRLHFMAAADKRRGSYVYAPGEVLVDSDVCTLLRDHVTFSS